MLVFIAALKREIDKFSAFVDVDRVERIGSAVFTEGHYGDEPVVVVQSGIGMHRSLESIEVALDRYRPDLVVSIGFSGAMIRSMVR